MGEMWGSPGSTTSEENLGKDTEDRGCCVSYSVTEQRDWPFRTGSSSTVGAHNGKQRRIGKEGRKGPRGMTACHTKGSLSLVGDWKLIDKG